MYTMHMSIKKPINPITLESLIEDLDQRGLLVLQVLLGQQAMKLLTEDKIKEKTSTILDPSSNKIKVLS
jgi:hypothetical protein